MLSFMLVPLGAFNLAALDSYYAAFPSDPLHVVVHVGHSLEEGVQDNLPGAPDWYANRYSNLLRRDIQAQLYPGVLGGIGFMAAVDSMNTPMLAGTGSYLGGIRTGVWSDHRFNTDGAKGACLRYTQSEQDGSSFKFYKASANLSSKSWAGVPTSCRVLYQSLPGGRSFTLRVTNYGGSIVYQSFTVQTASPDNLPHYGQLSPLLSLSQGFYVEVIADSGVRIEGIQFFSGDESSGFRSVNFACGGSLADSFSSEANMDAIMAQEPDIIVAWADHNDIFGVNASGPSGWFEKWAVFLSKIKARGVPGLFKLGYDYNSGVWSTMQFYAEKLALAYGWALFSHWVHSNQTDAWSFNVPLGNLLQGKVHFTTAGQQYEADLMRQILLP